MFKPPRQMGKVTSCQDSVIQRRMGKSAKGLGHYFVAY